MIQLKDICLSFGSREIFKDLNWNIKDGKRIGLFGPNGEGKTTLLNIIAGLTSPDSGSVIMPPSSAIGYLPQEVEETESDKTVVEEGMTAFGDVLDLEREIETVRKGLDLINDKDSEEYRRALHKLDALQNELKARDSHTALFRAEKLLTGLGFETDDLDKPLSTFSGGWRMRVALAKLLLVNPDILLLDEPTNHLDIESIDWLENYLSGFGGSVVLVSHDQYFLDRMVDVIAELNTGIITEYTGNYSSYLEERKSRLEIHSSAYENQQRKIKETERFIERFRYKNTKAKQVQSRVKMLEKLERIPPPPSEDAVMRFKFPEPERSGKVVMDISEFSKSYEREDGGAVDVFVGARPLTVSRGDKIALIGKNGAGKSTLARILLGTEPFHGNRRVGHNVEVTFFAQHQAETLDPRKTVLEEMESEAAAQNETEIRSLLGAFLFSDNDVYKKVSVLSGGEKSRVALAKTLLSPKNFMILDEPTNHLDIQSRNVLIEALKQYKGTFVIVSHDRHFLDEVANKIWYAEGSKVVTYPGTYSEFRYHQSQKMKSDSDNAGKDVVRVRSVASELVSESPQDLSSRELDKKKEAEKRNRLHRELKDRGIENMDNWSELTSSQLSKALAELEKKIHELEDKRTELETFLADPDNFRDQNRSQEASREFSLIGERLGRLYDKWEAVTSHLEKMPAD